MIYWQRQLLTAYFMICAASSLIRRFNHYMLHTTHCVLTCTQWGSLIKSVTCKCENGLPWCGHRQSSSSTANLSWFGSRKWARMTVICCLEASMTALHVWRAYLPLSMQTLEARPAEEEVGKEEDAWKKRRSRRVWHALYSLEGYSHVSHNGNEDGSIRFRQATKQLV